MEAYSALSWADVPVNWILISVTALLLMFTLPRLVGLLPYLWKGSFRTKPVYDLENNVRLSRDRNSMAAIMVIPFNLIVSRYNLFPAGFIQKAPLWQHTIIIIVVGIGYILLREMLHAAFRPKKKGIEDYDIARKCGYNFEILCTLTLVGSVTVLHIFNAGDILARKVSYMEICLFFIFFLFVKSQILSKSCNQLKSILYLCTLEILPVATLVATALIF